MIRVVEEVAVDELRNTVGSAFAIGVTKAAPTMKEISSSEGKVGDTVHLKDHDVIRVVTCNLEDLDFDPQEDVAPCSALSEALIVGKDAVGDPKDKRKQVRLPPFPGTDIEFLQSESGLTDSHFNLKFKKLLGSSSTALVRQLQCRSAIGTDEWDAAGISMGDQLVKDGVAHSVESVSGQTVKCVRAGCEGEGTALSLGVDIATKLADACLEQ